MEKRRHATGCSIRVFSGGCAKKSMVIADADVMAGRGELSWVSRADVGSLAKEMLRVCDTANMIAQRLRSTNLTVKEICTELEFPNESFFGRFVKKHLGCTPASTATRCGRQELYTNNSPVAEDNETLHLSHISVMVAPFEDKP